MNKEHLDELKQIEYRLHIIIMEYGIDILTSELGDAWCILFNFLDHSGAYNEEEV